MQDLLSWAIDGTLPPGARAGGATLVEEPMDHGASFDRGGGGGSKVTFEGEDLAALVEQYMESNRAMLERLNTSL